MASETTHNYVRTIAFIIAIVISIMSLASSYVSKDAFLEFKEGTITAIMARLDRIERKQDTLINYWEQNSEPFKRPK